MTAFYGWYIFPFFVSLGMLGLKSSGKLRGNIEILIQSWFFFQRAKINKIARPQMSHCIISHYSESVDDFFCCTAQSLVLKIGKLIQGGWVRMLRRMSLSRLTDVTCMRSRQLDFDRFYVINCEYWMMILSWFFPLPVFATLTSTFLPFLPALVLKMVWMTRLEYALMQMNP